MEGGLIDILQNKANEIIVNQSIITLTLSSISFFLVESLDQLTLPGFIFIFSVWFNQSIWKKSCKLFCLDFERWKSNLFVDLSVEFFSFILGKKTRF